MPAHFIGFLRKQIGTVLQAAGDVQAFNSFFKRDNLNQEVEFLIGLGGLLGLFQNFQALKEQSLLVKYMGIVKLLVQLKINAVGTFQ